MPVTALPGASAVLAALAVAGLPTDQFFFAGFLPPKQAARRARIAELARIPATLVLFETGPRLAATLADLAAGLGAARGRAVPRTDQAARGNPPRRSRRRWRKTLRRRASRAARSSLVIAPPAAPQQPSAGETDACCAQALARVSLKDAVGEVADATGLPRREVYQRALALQRKDVPESRMAAPR